MFSNYIKVAFRTIIKNRLYSFINLGGLAIGLAACILIFLFVQDELSYDSWVPEGEQVFRLEQTLNFPGSPTSEVVTVPGPVKAALEKDFPSDIESVARLYRVEQPVSAGDRQFIEEIYYIDREFISIFPPSTIRGNLEGGLANTSSVLLSKTMAEKYFGSQDPIGNVLTVDGSDDLVVAGVYDDFTNRSHLANLHILTLLDSGRSVVSRWIDGWGASNFYLYLKLKNTSNPETLKAGFKEFARRNVVFQSPSMKNLDFGNIIQYQLMPLESIHLRSNRGNDLTEGGDIAAVYTFSAIAGLILLIACFNFMNLTSAKSIQRAREVSLRKVVGASRRQLIQQFLGETALMIVFATILAVVLTEVSLPFYNSFLGKELELSILTDPILLLMLLGLVIFVGIMGGAYPAFILSSYKPAEILKSNKSSSETSPAFRNILVLLQFSISIGLVIATAVVYGQANYARQLDPGYEKDQTLVIRNMSSSKVKPLMGTIKTQMEAISGVEVASFSLDVPPLNNANSTNFILPGGNVDSAINMQLMMVDVDFLAAYKIEMVAGRPFSEDFRTDFLRTLEDDEVPLHNMIVNESAARSLGFQTPSGAIGQTVQAVMGGRGFEFTPKTIIGVIPDLQLRSVRSRIVPMVYFARDDDFFNFLTLRVSSNNLEQTLQQVDQVWRNVVPTVPIQRSFVAEDFAALYQDEERRALMLAAFSGFAILVASLGLFGLASYAAEKRTKEIGIRKVLGASVVNVVRLLVFQFSKPVLFANLIAWPIAWYFMNDWLNGFVYRISLNPLFFIVAGVTALLIAWATISGHAFRVAKTNPIHALRTE